MGLVEIIDIIESDRKTIKNKDAINAGYASLKELDDILDKFTSGNIYKIRVRYYSEDPRIKLRQKTDFSEKELDEILKKLDNMDKRSKQGPWTNQVLNAIKLYPELRAADLSAKINKEKDWLKPHVRKLKNLGLTISHGVGYSISPLGKIILSKKET